MYAEVFEQLGLYKNEARVYEALLQEGELSVGGISVKSQVHRRNVYDTLNRLVEKGLVFEIVQRGENRYRAVDPSKLEELIQEKHLMLKNVKPNLLNLYKSTPHKDDVFVYRGPEGWKNYMQDMLRINEDAYFIGAKGGWLDPRVKHYLPRFLKEAQRKKIHFFHLFDYDVKIQCPEIVPKVGNDFRFLPKGYSTSTAIDIFGDHVNIISGMNIGGLEENFSFTVIVNESIAEAYRTWFKFMWDFCPNKN